ncbi:hypothetical protein [Candidatus Foliamicus sp.]
MKKKFAWIAIPLVAVLCIGTYVFLSDRPQKPDTLAESESAPDASGSFPDSQSPIVAENMTGVATGAPNERPPERKTNTIGDLTNFTLTHGDIGYVDVNSIMQGRDPYSIVDLLQSHHELTGADDSLEIAIESISENEIWGQEVFFRQLIDGQPTNEVGKLFFSPDGTVTRVYSDLLNTESLNTSDIVILAPEAEAMAANVAARYAENIEVHLDWSDVPLTFTTHSAEMRYELDSDSNLVRLWHVEVTIDGPVMDGVRVSVSPETGEVVRVDSALVYFQATADHSIHVVDADRPAPGKSGARTVVWKDGECMIKSLCNDPKYTAPLETVRDVIADVQSVSKRYITNPITIMVNYPKKLLNAEGAWDESSGTIYIRVDVTDLEGIAAHEAYHAASQSQDGPVEHGLVYAMTALRGWDSWHNKGTSVTRTRRTYTSDGPHTTNMMYRVAQELGDYDAAFQFVLEVDKLGPSSIYGLVTAMKSVSIDLKIPISVHKVLLAVGEIDQATYENMLLDSISPYGIGSPDWVDYMRQQFEDQGWDEAEAWERVIRWIERFLRNKGSG